MSSPSPPERSVTPSAAPATFTSEGHTIRGWWFEPSGPGGATVVMAHGFAAVKEQHVDRFARAFAAAGFGVLLYDQPGFGASEGTVRQEVDPFAQQRAYRDAVTYVSGRDDVDPRRIGVWGTSFSGGTVLDVAAVDERIACVVAQVPATSGRQAALERDTEASRAALQERLDSDRLRRMRGLSAETVPVVSQDPDQLCAMPGADSYRFFTESAERAPAWQNRVTLRSLELAREIDQGERIGRIAPTPVLLVVATEDTLTPTPLALRTFERAREPRCLRFIEGGHFAPYVEEFDKASSEALEWFHTHL